MDTSAAIVGDARAITTAKAARMNGRIEFPPRRSPFIEEIQRLKLSRIRGHVAYGSFSDLRASRPRSAFSATAEGWGPRTVVRTARRHPPRMSGARKSVVAVTARRYVLCEQELCSRCNITVVPFE